MPYFLYKNNELVDVCFSKKETKGLDFDFLTNDIFKNPVLIKWEDKQKKEIKDKTPTCYMQHYISCEAELIYYRRRYEILKQERKIKQERVEQERKIKKEIIEQERKTKEAKRAKRIKQLKDTQEYISNLIEKPSNIFFRHFNQDSCYLGRINNENEPVLSFYHTDRFIVVRFIDNKFFFQYYNFFLETKPNEPSFIPFFQVKTRDFNKLLNRKSELPIIKNSEMKTGWYFVSSPKTVLAFYNKNTDLFYRFTQESGKITKYHKIQRDYKFSPFNNIHEYATPVYFINKELPELSNGHS